MRAINFNGGWTCKHLDDVGPGVPVTKTDAYYGEALAVAQSDESGAIELTVTDSHLSGKAAVPII